MTGDSRERERGGFVVRAESLGKMYTIRTARRASAGSLREAWADAAAAAFQRRARNPVPRQSPFWALRDVSFEIGRGEVVAIIGRNGAGKSTLLKVLSQITEPSEGRARLRGRVASLLEVGTGFHQELTGRENIFLNGAILGMSRHEVRSRFDDIVEFAEIGEFLDTPVKRYSSGMYVRLAFAVAAHLEPEILVVDEVLAVGDAEFQKKCLGRMDAVARSGRTVLFVSHNMATVQRLCTRGLLLKHGRLEADGPISEVIESYNTTSRDEPAGGFDSGQRSGTGWARVTDMCLVDDNGHAVGSVPSDSDVRIETVLSVVDGGPSRVTLKGLVLELMFYNSLGQPLTSVMNVDDPGVALPESSRAKVTMRLKGPVFVPGRYRVNVVLGIPYLQHVDEIVDAFTFEVGPPSRPWRPYDLHEVRGNVCFRADWSVAG